MIDDNSWLKIWGGSAVLAIGLLVGAYTANQSSSGATRGKTGSVRVAWPAMPSSSDPGTFAGGSSSGGGAPVLNTANGGRLAAQVEVMVSRINGLTSLQDALNVRELADRYAKQYQDIEQAAVDQGSGPLATTANNMRLAFVYLYSAADARVMSFRSAPGAQQSWNNQVTLNENTARKYARAAQDSYPDDNSGAALDPAGPATTAVAAPQNAGQSTAD